MKKRRPFFLYVLVILFGISGLISLVGILGVVQSWHWMAVFSSALSPTYSVFRGLFLGLLSFCASLILWLKIPWGVSFGSAAALLTAAWFWVERLVFAENPLPFSRSIAPFFLTCFLLVLALSSLYCIAPFLQQSAGSQSHSLPQIEPVKGEEND